MKRQFICWLLITACVLLGACGSDNTPGEAAGQVVELMKKGDIKAYVNMLYYPEEETQSEEATGQQKDQIYEMMEGFIRRELERKGGIQYYKVVSEDVKGDRATVKMAITFGNEQTEESEFRLIKTKEGKWMVNFGGK